MEFKSQEELYIYLDRTLKETLGESAPEFNVEIESLQVFCDIRKIIRSQDFISFLQHFGEGQIESDILEETLNELHQDHPEALWIPSLVRNQKKRRSFLEEAYLDEDEINLIEDILLSYSEIGEQIGEVNNLEWPEPNNLLNITSSEIDEYVSRYAKHIKDNPFLALIPISQIEKLVEDDALAILDEPQKLIEIFSDEDYYIRTANWLDAQNLPFPADVSRLILSLIRIVKNFNQGQEVLNPILTDARKMLQKLDSYNPRELATFQELQDIIRLPFSMLHLLFGNLQIISKNEQMYHLERAEYILSEAELPVLRPFLALVKWERAQKLPETLQMQLESEAMALINSSIAEAMMIDDPIERAQTAAIGGMMPMVWKFSKGDYKGAIEAASFSRPFSQILINIYQAQMAEFFKELDNIDTDQDLTDREKQIFLRWRNLVETMIRSQDTFLFLHDIIVLESQARIAEMGGNYSAAYLMYEQAASLQRKVYEHFKQLLLEAGRYIKALNIPELQSQSTSTLKHEALAIYFHAMALINHGDDFLIHGDFSSAEKDFASAKSLFLEAAEFWDRELERLQNSNSPIGQQKNTFQLIATSDSRAQFCDSRLEFVKAERQSSLGKHNQASSSFLRAKSILEALLIGDSFENDLRSQKLIKASSDLALGRSLFEFDLWKKETENVNEANGCFAKAIILLKEVGESRLADFAEALRLEYEALIRLEVGKRLGNEVEMQLALSKASDAARVYRICGANERALQIETNAKTMFEIKWIFGPYHIPSPSNRFLADNAPTEQVKRSASNILEQQEGQSFKEIKMSAKLRPIQARAIALQSTLDDLKDRRDKGRINAGEYADLRTDLDRERIELLLELQSLMKGYDDDFDSVMQEAVVSPENKEEEIKEKLKDLAEKKGLGTKVIEAIDKHRGIIITWLIDIGSELIKRSQQPL